MPDPACVISTVTVKMALQFPCAAASGTRVTETGWQKSIYLGITRKYSLKRKKEIFPQKRKKGIAHLFDSKYLV